jgi:uroporphyrinogen-III synthase
VHGIPAASIGPTTTKTATELGYSVRVQAPEDQVTIQGLVDSILGYLK